MNSNTITVFISYSHENQSHADWVRNLAEKLVFSGIDVIFDQWHLLAGHDVAQFMEDSLEKASYVLLICTPDYARKFNNREGGVAHETDLILGQVLTSNYRNQNFIPLLRSGKPSDAIPRYLKTKLYIDFTNEDFDNNSFDQLLRRLKNTPKYSPPKLKEEELNNLIIDKGVSQNPKAWLLVAGLGSADLPEKIKDTAQSLARFIVEKDYGLITGGWIGVDELVSRIFAREISKCGKDLENFLIQIVAERNVPAFPAGNMILVKKGTEEWIEGIKLADAIILIGGIGGTWETGKIGLEYRKAVLPLADTGGDALKFYMHMLNNWNVNFFKQIEQKEFHKLGREAPDVVEVLESILEKI